MKLFLRDNINHLKLWWWRKKLIHLNHHWLKSIIKRKKVLAKIQHLKLSMNIPLYDPQQERKVFRWLEKNNIDLSAREKILLPILMKIQMKDFQDLSQCEFDYPFDEIDDVVQKYR